MVESNINNYNLIVKNPNKGVGTVWLLSTLGSKSSHKKLFKRDILNTSIRDTCKMIKESRISLRYSSNLLYGVSLLYRHKVDYVYTDITLVHTRLQRDFVLRGYNENNNSGVSGSDIRINNNAIEESVPRPQQFLVEDPLFDIEMDLVIPFLESDDIHQDKCEVHFAAAQQLTTFLPDDDIDPGIDFDFDVEILNEGNDSLKAADLDANQEQEGEHPNVLDLLDDLEAHAETATDYNTQLDELTNTRLKLLLSFENNDTPTTRKKRVLTDSSITIPTNILRKTSTPRKRSLEYDYESLFLEESTSLPPFVNFSYNYAYSGIRGITRLPNYKRHRQGQPYMDDEELEISRRLFETSRKNLNLMDSEILRNDESILDIDLGDIGYDPEQGNLENTFDMSIPNLEMISETSESQPPLEGEFENNEVESTIQFLGFLQARSQSHGERISEDMNCISFDTLIPTASVSKKIAAASFASILILTTSDHIRLVVTKHEKLLIRNDIQVLTII